MGTRPADGAVADGRGRRVPARRRHARAKALTGVDDHSRFCVSARLMPRERTQAVCDGLAAAMRTLRGAGADPDRQRQGVHRPVRPPAGGGAVRPDLPGERRRAPADRSPGRQRRPGKIERFHRTLRTEFDTARVFDEPEGGAGRRWTSGWTYYNRGRPHQALDDATPAERFGSPAPEPQRAGSPARPTAAPRERPGQQWVSRKVGANGIVCVGLAAGQRRQAPRRRAHATSWSPSSCCSSGSATNSSRPSPEPARGRDPQEARPGQQARV